MARGCLLPGHHHTCHSTLPKYAFDAMLPRFQLTILLQVLTELGYSNEEIAELREKRII